MKFPLRLNTKSGHAVRVTNVANGVFHFEGQTSNGNPINFDYVHKGSLDNNDERIYSKIDQTFSGEEMEVLSDFFKEAGFQG